MTLRTLHQKHQKKNYPKMPSITISNSNLHATLNGFVYVQMPIEARTNSSELMSATVDPEANFDAAPSKAIGLVSLVLGPVEVPLVEESPLEPEPVDLFTFEQVEEGTLTEAVPVEEGTPPEAVPVADGLIPVALRLTKTPPETCDGAVLLPLMAARTLYASRVFGDGGAGSLTTMFMPV